MSRTLVVTNDFPPRRGGIESYVRDLCDDLPADDVVVHTARMAGASAYEELVDQVVTSLGVSPGAVEAVRVTEEDEYFPPPRALRDLIEAVELAATLLAGGSIPDRPSADDRRLPASAVLTALA